MKKLLLIIALMGTLTAIVSCGNDDEPINRDGKINVNPAMINHMVNAGGEAVIGISMTHNKLNLDMNNHKATVELNYNDGQGDKQLVLEDITATETPEGSGFYVLSSASYKSFSGYADFSEHGAYRFRYTTTGGIRIISTMPEVFFLNTHNVVTYDDETEATTLENVMYEFTIDPAAKTATVKVNDVVHVKDNKNFTNITATSVPVTVTPIGYSINATNLPTTATYLNYVDSTGSGKSTTNKYPFKTFNATIDLVNDHLDANYMIGSSATVTATGKTYLERH